MCLGETGSYSRSGYDHDDGCGVGVLEWIRSKRHGGDDISADLERLEQLVLTLAAAPPELTSTQLACLNGKHELARRMEPVCKHCHVRYAIIE